MKRPQPTPNAILRGHTTAITALSFLPTPDAPDRYVLAGDEKGTIRLWDIVFEEALLIHPIPKTLSATPVQSFAIHPNAPSSALVQYKTGHVMRLDLAYDPSAADLDSWTAHTRDIRVKHLPPSLADAPSQHALLADSFCPITFLSPHVWIGPAGDGSAVVIRDDRQSFVYSELLDPSKEHPTGMLMTLTKAGNDMVFTGYEDGSVASWDVRKPSSIVTRINIAKEPVIAVAVSPFGRVGVAGGAFASLAGVADLQTELTVVETATLKNQGIADIAWHPHGKLIATAGWDGRVRIWDGRRRPASLLRSKGMFSWHDGTVQRLAYSSTGAYLVSGGKDQSIAIWNGI